MPHEASYGAVILPVILGTAVPVQCTVPVRVKLGAISCPASRHVTGVARKIECTIGGSTSGRQEGDGHNTAQSHWSGTRVAFTPRHTHHTRNHLIVELHLGTLHSLAGEQGVI